MKDKLTGKLTTYSVFSTKECGRQNSNMVPRILPPGLLVLSHPFLLSVGRAGDEKGFPSMMGLPYVVKVKGFC